MLMNTFTNTLPNIIKRTRPLFMFVHLTNRTEFLIHVRSFIERTNINELPVERFMNCLLNVRFVYSPNNNYKITIEMIIFIKCIRNGKLIITIMNANKNLSKLSFFSL
ncbi:hypothetical protein Hanom_Chr11g00969201 [Helianthus anomalus]